MSVFKFKHFEIRQEKSAMKVGTDSMVLGALICSEGNQRGLDIGCGTGVLSLMLTQKNSLLLVDALEIEAEASDEAKSNILNSNFKEQITVFNQDFLLFEPDKKYDLIFSNPPYFLNSMKSAQKAKEMARHTDTLPVPGFTKKVSELLSEKGSCWVIFPQETFELFFTHCSENELYLNEKIHIYGKPDRLTRFVGRFSKFSSPLVESSLQIRDEKGKYTEQYKELTKEYHSVKL